MLVFVLSLNLLNAQKETNASFLKFEKINEVELEATIPEGAFTYANDSILLIGGGFVKKVENSTLDTLTTLNNWNTRLTIYDLKNGQKNQIDFPPIALGVSIATPKGLLCAGGVMHQNRLSIPNRSVLWVDENGVLDTLLLMPTDFTCLGGVFFEGKVYLLGNRGSKKSKDWELLVFDPENARASLEMIDSPVTMKGSFSSLAIQGNGLDNCLYIFGKHLQTEKLLKYNLKTGTWSAIFEYAQKKVNDIQGDEMKAFPIGNSSVLLFEPATVPDTLSEKITNQITVFNTITESTTSKSLQTELAVHSIVGGGTDVFYLIGKKNKEQAFLYKAKYVNTAPGFAWLNIAVLAIYFLLMLWIGFYFSKKQRSADDYFKAGKRIPYWAAGLSLLGTGLSAISFMAVPAKAYATDWAYYAARFPTILIPIIIGLLYIPIFRKLDITTAYEYLQKRFNLAIRLIGSFAFIFFQLGRIGIVLFLPAVALNVVTGFDVLTCILLMGIVSLIYTIGGGIEAVIWTDVLQVIILYGGIILCVAFIAFELDGGFSEIISIGSVNQKFNIFDFSFNLDDPNFWVVVGGSFFTSLTTYGSDQTMVQRYLTTKTDNAATNSMWVTITISFLLGWLFFFMGTALYAFYKENPDQMLHTMVSNDGIFPWYIISQLPKGISGVLIAGIFAAAMSSLSSSMNSGATAYTMDFHKLFKREFDAVKVGRIVTLIIGLGGILFAILFATMAVKSIWDQFLKIIGLMTGGLGGLFLLGITTQRANGAGALIGLLISSVIQYYVASYQPFNLFLFTASGFISCYIFGYLFSLFLPQYNKPIDGLTIFSLKSQK